MPQNSGFIKKVLQNNYIDNLWSLDYNINMKEILTYKTKDGKCPFDIWMNSLDNSMKVRVSKRIERIEEGNYGDYKKLDNELSELRFKFGSGYRIYFAEVDNIIIILLCAGDKSTQVKDIEKAKEYLQDLKERNK